MASSENIVVAACHRLSSQEIQTLSTLCSPEEFSREWVGSLYEAALRLAEEGADAADPDLVASRIRPGAEHPDIFTSWAHAYLSLRSEDTAQVRNAAFHARAVRESHARRCAHTFAATIAQQATDGAEIGEIAASASEIIELVARSRGDDRAMTAREAAEDAFEYMQTAMDADSRRRVLFGLPEIDEALGGLSGGDLCIIAARTSVGKSALALNITNRLLSSNRPILYASLEMPSHQLMARLTALRMQFSISKILRGQLTTEEAIRAQHILEDIGERPMYIFAPGSGKDASPHPDVIRSIARQIQARHGDVAAIVVDYLQLMEADRHRIGSRQEEVSVISRRLKLLAIDLKVPVIALSQLRRPQPGREGDSPMMSELRESGSIENDADCILILHREVEACPQTMWVAQMSASIAKNRNGPTISNIPLLFHSVTGAFAPQPKPKEEDEDAA